MMERKKNVLSWVFEYAALTVLLCDRRRRISTRMSEGLQLAADEDSAMSALGFSGLVPAPGARVLEQMLLRPVLSFLAQQPLPGSSGLQSLRKK